jgi:quercetin dioxygenase-like cupin family protein
MLKRMLYALAVLGWVPTLAIVCGAKWIAGVPLLGQGHAPVKVTRLYTGSDGKTKVEEFEIPLKARDRGTDLSQPVAVTGLQFRRTNQDYFLDWHPAPTRQFVVTLSGESEVELEGGKKIRLGPGNILLAEDTTGKGHISRAVGSQDRISLFIPLADGATLPR